VAARNCPACGAPNPATAHFCARCGARFPVPRPAPVWGRYSSLRLQVDPSDPPPQRDARWVALVLGGCFLVIGVFLLGVAAILSAAGVNVLGACGLGSCTSSVFLAVLVLPGIAALGGGVAALLYVALRGLS
jgi:zinc-ribbon domain